MQLQSEGVSFQSDTDTEVIAQLIAHYLNGLACQKHPAVEGRKSLPVIKIRELRQGIIANSDRATADVATKYIVEDGDILFSWSGSLLVSIWCNGRGVLNQHVFKVTSGRYPKWYFYHATKHHLEEFQRIAADKATTMGHIQRHHLSSAKLAVKPLNTQPAFGRFSIRPKRWKRLRNSRMPLVATPNCRASLDVIVFYGVPVDRLQRFRKFDMVSGNWEEFARNQDAAIVGQAVAQRRMLHSPDLHNDPRVRFPEFARQSPLRSMLAAPLMVGDRALGVLTVLRQRVHEFTEDDQRVVGALADQAAIALEHARLYEELEARVQERTRQLEPLLVRLWRERLQRGNGVRDPRPRLVRRGGRM